MFLLPFPLPHQPVVSWALSEIHCTVLVPVYHCLLKTEVRWRRSQQEVSNKISRPLPLS
jgi:hypothetical protein